MAIERLEISIKGDAPGRRTSLRGFRIGPSDASKKVYLQGALHADEQPGIMALCQLVPLLIAADEAGHVNAEFVVFPMVNPIGMATVEFGMHQGRYDLPSGVNFNRNWPDIFPQIESGLREMLGTDASDNQNKVRNAIRQWLENTEFQSARMQLRKAVMLESHNADYVFDLHCDDLSLLHIFASPHCNVQMQSLSDWLGGSAILTAEDSGGGSFDEVFPLLWIKAQNAFSDIPLPPPPAACTIELRGQKDVSDTLGQQDADERQPNAL